MKKFICDESGLTTVEWVALTAVLFLAAIGISSFVLQSVDGLGGAVAGRLDATANSVNGANGGGTTP